MHEMLLGAIAMASFTAGLFFLKFWRSTRDSFFLFFAVAFWLQAIGRVILSLIEQSENIPSLYLIRLSGFGLILFAIINKNWPKKSSFK